MIAYRSPCLVQPSGVQMLRTYQIDRALSLE